jgi:hypothetical protein
MYTAGQAVTLRKGHAPQPELSEELGEDEGSVLDFMAIIEETSISFNANRVRMTITR